VAHGCAVDVQGRRGLQRRATDLSS
jgi:hypothetical protein